MAIYEFRYAGIAGNVVRTTIMQCEADSVAIDQARDTMQDRYATLEIFEGDRPLFLKRQQAQGPGGGKAAIVR
jgi:hypothetical protein